MSHVVLGIVVVLAKFHRRHAATVREAGSSLIDATGLAPLARKQRGAQCVAGAGQAVAAVTTTVQEWMHSTWDDDDVDHVNE